jgi:proteasome lid subunit RPN8/RPN11
MKVTRARARGPVQMKQHDFLRMMRELERRSQHRREAGAFLLSPSDASAPNVSAVAYYDDLDPQSLTGGITFHAAGYTRLNKLCRDEQVCVIADLHLHPGSGVRQSDIDSAHPMVARAGHLALIAPRYGLRVTRADQLGAHLKTVDGWTTYVESAVQRLFVVQPTLRGRALQLRSFVRRAFTKDKPDEQVGPRADQPHRTPLHPTGG